MNTNKQNFSLSSFEIVKRIQSLNDAYRLKASREEIIFNIPINKYSDTEVAEIFKILRFSKIFDYGTHPDHEHDYACFSYNGINYRWSITYQAISSQTIDTTNPNTCKRVLTVDFDRRGQSKPKIVN